jgi:hypothetical protein
MNTKGEIFNQTSINADRPRSKKDEELLKIESSLLDEFYSEVEPNQ